MCYNYLVSERQTNLLNKNLKIRIAKMDLNVFNFFVIMITSARAKQTLLADEKSWIAFLDLNVFTKNVII